MLSSIIQFYMPIFGYIYSIANETSPSYNFAKYTVLGITLETYFSALVRQGYKKRVDIASFWWSMYRGWDWLRLYAVKNTSKINKNEWGWSDGVRTTISIP